MLESLFPGGLSQDSLLGGTVNLAQPVGGYRVAVDPVLLAAAVRAEPGERVADLGCGTGAVSLCLAARLPECTVVALDRETDLAALTRANVAANAFTGRIAVVAGDIARLPFADGAFDHVAMNPPYLTAGRSSVPKERLRRVAAVEGAARLTDWLAAGLSLVRLGGTITLVHRADRLDHIVAIFRTLQTGGLSVSPVWPKPGREARRVIVRCRKGDRSPFALLAGLTLHDAAGRFTPAAEKVLRGGQDLDTVLAPL
ncbi:MAG TPA: methyltransferase domain-containing protein [Alphaproteobacteria bacterium]|nr:methyltransferase domain-containing protein [Alphaproteobacteria bacterium]